MAGQRCQVCGGKVVNGRCSLCGMPYRNDEVLYHLNEPREIHYKHASAKVRDMMRQYGQDADQTTQHNGNVNRNISAVRSGSTKCLYFRVYRNIPFLFSSAVLYSCLAQHIDEKQYIEDIGTIYSILHSDLYIAQGGMSNVICDQERRDKRGV